MRTGDAQRFFASTDASTSLLAERAHWLEAMPGECALLTGNGAALLEEAAAFAKAWGVSLPPSGSVLHALGRVWEPDFVLLSAGDAGLIVEGGVVCFPSSWSLREKLGRSLEFTHGPVPRLNEQLGSRIDVLLRKLAPGAAWERENWGLARSSERNRHPQLARRRLDETITPAEVWLRVEEQLLMRLPATGGILFGIRLVILPFAELLAVPTACEGLRQALATMPDDALDYKGLASARPILLKWLENTSQVFDSIS
jgi:hypothetical protein